MDYRATAPHHGNPSYYHLETMTRCLNIDWLEVFLLEDAARFPCDADFFEREGWRVERRQFGTRVYEEMFYLYGQDGHRWFEIRRKPYSDAGTVTHGMFSERSCHLRFCNRTCYIPHCIDLLRNFLVTYGYELRKIYRLDICMDFERFDYGDLPGDFMTRYLRGRYAKINQANIAAHGTDRWDGRTWNSVSWGARKSMVGTKFYNKSLELRQVQDKPYIRQAWLEAGLIDDYDRMTKRDQDGNIYTPDIWRLEFSIKAGSRRWFRVEDNSHRKERRIAMPHTLDMYDTDNKLLLVFASLTEHYFHFKHYQDGVRKDRCTDKRLFKFRVDESRVRLETTAAATRRDFSLEVLRSRLEQYKQQHYTREVAQAVDTLLDSITENSIARTTQEPYDFEYTRILRRMVAYRLQYGDEVSLDECIRMFFKQPYDGF